MDVNEYFIANKNSILVAGSKQILINKLRHLKEQLVELKTSLQAKQCIFNLYRSELIQFKQIRETNDKYFEEKLEDFIIVQNQSTRIIKKLSDKIKAHIEKIDDCIENIRIDACSYEDANLLFNYIHEFINLEEIKDKYGFIDRNHAPENFKNYLKKERILDENFNCSIINELTSKQMISIAVMGRRGAGKSSFINALQDINSYDENAARTGETECTLINQCFELSLPRETNDSENYNSNENIKIYIWDFPGVGTESFPSTEYKKMIESMYTDIIIYLFHPDFDSLDESILNTIKSSKKKYLLIRHKVDCDFENILKTRGDFGRNFDDLTEEEIREIVNKEWDPINRKLINYYENTLPNEEVFFLSSSDTYKKYFDFEIFLSKMIASLPDHKKSNWFQKYVWKKFKTWLDPGKWKTSQ